MPTIKREQFLSDVKSHKMIVLFDNEFNRHIKFCQPGTSNCWFDIIMWKNCLCINGDMGTYVFSRTEDMFSFFRRKELEINPSYWSEKCVSESIFGEGIRKFSVKLFEENVRDRWQAYFEDSDGDEEKERAKVLAWKDVQEQLLNREDEWEAVEAMRNFRSDHIEFNDFFETSCEDYTYHFLWCLYAIVWGIQQYDLHLPTESRNEPA